MTIRHAVLSMLFAWVTLLSSHSALAQYIQQGPKLVGSGALASARQGSSVALSADGNTAIVGGDFSDGGTGAAWIWNRNRGVWTESAKLVGWDAVGSAWQGYSVAISADGNTAVVGGTFDNNYLGAIWVWTRNGDSWTQQGSKLVGSGSTAQAQQQGYSVSVSADGNTVIAGAPGSGAAWIWTRSGGVWTQQGSRLVGSGALGQGRQGNSVSLSADGNTAMVGGPADNTLVFDQGSFPTQVTRGAVWVWTRSGGVWTQQGEKLFSTGATLPSLQGYSVSLASDGNTAIVGDPSLGGGARVWSRNREVWTQQGATLTFAGGASQGSSVALSADGNTAMIGGPSGAGAAWVWIRNGDVWTRQTSKLIGVGAYSRYGDVPQAGALQGFSVALSADGNTAIVGGPTDDLSEIAYTNIGIDAPAGAGAAWVWTRSGGDWEQQGPKLVGSIVGRSQQGSSVALSADGNTAIVGGPYDHGTNGAAWVWTRSSGVWTQSAKLVGSDAIGNAFQGNSVAISADGNTAIVGGMLDNADAGAAWVWTRSGGVWTQQGPKLVGAGAEGFGARQGSSVALSADGNTAIVGGVTDQWFGNLGEDPEVGVGAAWVWTRSGGAWTQQGAKLVGSGGYFSFYGVGQGYSVALSADGNTALVGANGDDAVWVWTRSGEVWSQQGPKISGSFIGRCVALSADGNTAALCGGFILTRSGGVWTNHVSLGVNALANRGQGFFVSLSADGNTAVVGNPSDEPGGAWVWNRSGGVWTLRGSKLVGTGAVPASRQGSSVAISFDGSTILLGGPKDDNLVGAAWVFAGTPGDVVTSPPRQRAIRH